MIWILTERPDLTLRELKDELQTSLSRQTLCKALWKLRFTLKKSLESQRVRMLRCGPTTCAVAGSAMLLRQSRSTWVTRIEKALTISVTKRKTLTALGLQGV